MVTPKPIPKELLSKNDLRLNKTGLKLVIKALDKVQTLPAGVACERAKKMKDRFMEGDTTTTLPEFNTLGLGLSRLDTKKSVLLLEKLKKQVTG